MDSLVREEIARINAQSVRGDFELMVAQDIQSSNKTVIDFWEQKLNTETKETK
jgi:hypothetical protein